MNVGIARNTVAVKPRPLRLHLVSAACGLALFGVAAFAISGTSGAGRQAVTSSIQPHYFDAHQNVAQETVWYLVNSEAQADLAVRMEDHLDKVRDSQGLAPAGRSFLILWSPIIAALSESQQELLTSDRHVQFVDLRSQGFGSPSTD